MKQVFLWMNNIEAILEKELTLWSSYYHNDGVRDLFVELPYYTAEYMNIWMKSEDNDILDLLYQDWAGTAMYSQEIVNFYKQIKIECPETVFHGTSVINIIQQENIFWNTLSPQDNNNLNCIDCHRKTSNRDSITINILIMYIVKI